MSEPLKFCKDCKWKTEDSPDCNHPSVGKTDLVSGSREKMRCRTARTDAAALFLSDVGAVVCGVGAKFFEPKDAQ